MARSRRGEEFGGGGAAGMVESCKTANSTPHARRNPHQFHPRKPASPSCSRAWCRNCTSNALPAAAGGQRLSRAHLPHPARHAVGFSSMSAWSARPFHVADIWQPREERRQAHRAHPFRGQSLVVQVVRIPSAQGGAPVDADFHRRPHAGLSPPRKSTSAFPSASSRKASARPCANGWSTWWRRTKPAASSSAPWPRGDRREFATDIAYLKKIWGDLRDKARVSGPADPALPGAFPRPAGAAGFQNPDIARIVIDSRRISRN